MTVQGVVGTAGAPLELVDNSVVDTRGRDVSVDLDGILRMRFESKEPAFITHLNVVERVATSWGEEQLLVPPDRPFSFRVITVKAGRHTSAHYHRHKEQATLVLSGEGALQISDSVSDVPARFRIGPGCVAHVGPGMVHRITARTDLVVAEVSVPSCDDTVRIDDDSTNPELRKAAEQWEP